MKLEPTSLRTRTSGRLLAALATYLLWVAVTWLLEGRLETLLRPEARVDRLLYAVVANLLIGAGGTLLVLRRYGPLAAAERIASVGGVRSLAWIAVGTAAGFALYALHGPPAKGPVVAINAYSQVFTVSTAEVLVCWALVGRAVEAAAEPRLKAIAPIVAALAASILFGVYHFAHSAPFNTIGMVSLLSLVGLLTSALFFISRSVAATIASTTGSARWASCRRSMPLARLPHSNDRNGRCSAWRSRRS